MVKGVPPRGREDSLWVGIDPFSRRFIMENSLLGQAGGTTGQVQEAAVCTGGRARRVSLAPRHGKKRYHPQELGSRTTKGNTLYCQERDSGNGKL